METQSKLHEYAQRLLASFPNPQALAQGKADPVPALDTIHKREREVGGLSGCCEAVEILTRNPKKGRSYLFLPFCTVLIQYQWWSHMM
jgi:hypothetical protein